MKNFNNFNNFLRTLTNLFVYTKTTDFEQHPPIHCEQKRRVQVFLEQSVVSCSVQCSKLSFKMVAKKETFSH